MDVGGVKLTGTLLDSALAESIWQLLPFESHGETWGEEVYFPVKLQSENTEPVEEVKVGDIAYWPDGPDLCLFFGPTPKSTDETPVTTSPVTVIGSFEHNHADFRGIQRERRGIRVVVKKQAADDRPAATDNEQETGSGPAETGQ